MASSYAYRVQPEFVERLPSGIFFRHEQLEESIGSTEAFEKGIDPYLFPVFRAHDSGYSSPRGNLNLDPQIASDKVDVRCLPLLDVDVEVNVKSTVARTRVFQTFTNLSSLIIKEATYSFPLYDGSAVVEFRCHIGEERVLEGVVKPKQVCLMSNTGTFLVNRIQTARREFKEAVEKQKVAALLEEHTPEVFETHLGNIPAKTRVKIEVTYVNELKADVGGDGVLVTIPTSIAPRYGTAPTGMSGSSETAKNGLHITVNVAASVNLRKLESRTHPISVEMGASAEPPPVASFADLSNAPESSANKFDPTKARATLSKRDVTLGIDFVLLILATATSMLSSSALLEPSPNERLQSAMMLSINPRELLGSYIEPEKFEGEIIFIADRSGSMHGPKIDTLRDALSVFLKSIPSENTCFNIYSFGSSYTSLFSKSQPYSQETLDTAIQHAALFAADMGGTEILRPIQNAVEQRVGGEKSTTQIIVLTDGETWDAENIIRFVSTTRSELKDRVRFFCLGIGNQVSHRLVEGIGRLGGGFAEVVAVDGSGRWKERIIRMLKGALMPASFDCELEFAGMPTKSACSDSLGSTFMQAPYQLPGLHPFTRDSVYFLFDKRVGTDLDAVTVKTTTPSGRNVAVTVPVKVSDDGTFIVHHLAAKAIVMDLESGKSWLHASKASNTAGIESSVQILGERLGAQYHITSKWTSFIAVENKIKEEKASRFYKADRSEFAMLSRARTAPMGNFAADQSLFSPFRPEVRDVLGTRASHASRTPIVVNQGGGDHFSAQSSIGASPLVPRLPPLQAPIADPRVHSWSIKREFSAPLSSSLTYGPAASAYSPRSVTFDGEDRFEEIDTQETRQRVIFGRGEWPGYGVAPRVGQSFAELPPSDEEVQSKLPVSKKRKKGKMKGKKVDDKPAASKQMFVTNSIDSVTSVSPFVVLQLHYLLTLSEF